MEAHGNIGISIYTNNDLSTDFSLSRVPEIQHGQLKRPWFICSLSLDALATPR